MPLGRFQVEQAQPKGGVGIARPWSKHSEGSSRAQKLAEAKTKKEKRNREKDIKKTAKSEKDQGPAAQSSGGGALGEVEKEEFMAALKRRSEARFWDNDDVALEQPQVVVKNDESSDDDSEEDRTRSLDDKDVVQPSSDIEGEKTDRVYSKNSVSDMDWLRSKVGGEEGDVEESSGNKSSQSERVEKKGTSEGKRSVSEKAGTQSRGDTKHRDGQNADSCLKSATQDLSDEGDEEEESGPSVGRLFVRNLPYTTSEDDLRELFETFGVLSEVHLPVDDVKKVPHMMTILKSSRIGLLIATGAGPLFLKRFAVPCNWWLQWLDAGKNSFFQELDLPPALDECLRPDFPFSTPPEKCSQKQFCLLLYHFLW